MENQLIAQMPLSDIERMAGAIAKSGLFGMKTPDQALALMLIAQAEGMHPALAARDYHVINGRPTLKADAMLARFQQSGGTIKYLSYTDQKVEAVLSHPQGGQITVEWTTERAKTAGLMGNPTWQKYPRQMLRARVLSEGIRTIFPSVCVGTYTPEEIEDAEPRNITPQRDPEPEPPKPTKAKKEEAKIDPAPTVEDAVIVPDKVETPAPAAKSGAVVATEIKEIRARVQQSGIKTQAEFSDAMKAIIGRSVDSAASLSHEERATVLADLRKRETKEAA